MTNIRLSRSGRIISAGGDNNNLNIKQTTEWAADLMKTPDSFFCTKSGIDKRIAEVNDQDEEGEDYMENLNEKFNKSMNISSTKSTTNVTTYSMDRSITSSQGKNSQVFFVKARKKDVVDDIIQQEDGANYDEGDDNSGSSFYAVKRQYIISPNDGFDKCYRELVIFQQLGEMMESNKCCNFIKLIEWYKSSPSSNADRDNKLLSKKAILNKNDLRSQQYMNYVMEYADLKSLADYKMNHEITLDHFQSMLFQIIYALSISQKEMEFMHNDLHIGNILLQKFKNPYKYIMYRDANRRWFVAHNIVKLSDYGLSRIKLPAGQNNKNSKQKETMKRHDQKDTDTIIYNPRNPDSKHFIGTYDLMNLVTSLNSVKISDIGSPQNAELKKQLINLKKKMTLFVYPNHLLSHPFFDYLTYAPADATIDNCIRISSDGFINDQEDIEFFKSLEDDDDDDDVDEQENCEDNIKETGTTPSTPISKSSSSITIIRTPKPSTPAHITSTPAGSVIQTNLNITSTPNEYKLYLKRFQSTGLGLRKKYGMKDNQLQNNNNGDEEDNGGDDDDVDDNDLDVDIKNLRLKYQSEIDKEDKIDDEEKEQEDKEESEEEKNDEEDQEVDRNEKDEEVEKEQVVPKTINRKKKLSKMEKLKQESDFILRRLIR